MGFKVKSSGIYIPKEKKESEWFDESNNKESGFTFKKTNLKSRNFISKEENVLTMGKEAINNALKSSNLNIEDIECIIYASGTSAQTIPYNAAMINAFMKNKNNNVTTFDVSSTCLSFVTALDIADKFFKAQSYKNILIVTSEVASIGLDYKNIEVSGIFGDGAAAFILESDLNKNNNVTSKFCSYPEHIDDCVLKGGGTLYPLEDFNNLEEYKAISKFEMNHKNLLRLILKELTPFWDSYLKESNIDINKVKKIVPHQGSNNIIDIIAKKLNFTDNFFVNNFKYNGNQIAASIPITLHLLLENKELVEGDNVILLGTSAGVSFGVLGLEI
jgi:3-oxoacyl-[acyl-carrier-protein] synthase-3